MLGKLTFDKASMNINYFLKSILIIYNNNGKISRYSFVRKMEIFQRGETSLAEVKPVKYTEAGHHRTQYNKSKLPRYFGFINLKKNKNSGDELVLTKRGNILAQLISVKNDDTVDNAEKITYYINDKNKPDFIRLFIESILYGTFGKNNSGAEQSNTDIELPKIIFKSILTLGDVSSHETLYIAESMNKGKVKSFEDAIANIKTWRKLDTTSYNKELSNQMQELERSINFTSDDKFIDFYTDENIPILEKRNRNGNTFYKIKDNIMDEYKNEFQQLIPVYRPLQIVLSGVPGTGKSYYVERCILGGVSNYNNIIRTILHPEYSYSDFIGFIRPQNINNKIKYIFSAGPLVKSLLRCYENPDQNVFLIIEEMNRGNFASIMGDTFQLLDRIDDFTLESHGSSQYYIENRTVYNFLKTELGKNQINITKILPEGKILFPSNLNIIGTMNTADQNVFVLDTAFRRRFRNLYLKINFEDEKKEGTKLYQLNELSKNNVFNGQGSWCDFAKMVNSHIDTLNSELTVIPEDKKLAPYFVDEYDLTSRQAFCDKVIYYLKNDVFKYVETFMDTSYEDLYNNLVRNERSTFFSIFD